MTSAVRSTRSPGSTFQKRCSASVMSGSAAPTSWRTGSCWYSRVSTPTSPSSVAENSIVWRASSVSSSSCAPAGRKPMSAMRSASSITTVSTESRRHRVLLDEVVRGGRGRRRACRRPCAARGAAGRSRRRRRRRDAAAARPRRAARARAGSARRARGSVRARGARGRFGLALPIRATSGMPKARVLPEPVGARPQTSRPARRSGMVAAWTSNGAVMPRVGERVDEVGGYAEISE